MTVYFLFVYENILTANNNGLSRLALMLIKVNGRRFFVYSFSFIVVATRKSLIKGKIAFNEDVTPEEPAYRQAGE